MIWPHEIWTQMVEDIFEAILEYCFDLQIQVSKHNPLFHTITIVLYLRPDPDPEQPENDTDNHL